MRSPTGSGRCPTEYADFYLLIQKVRGTYSAKVIKSPAGDGKTSVRLPALRESAASSVVVRGSRHLHAEDDSPREDGSELFRAVFRGEVRERWLNSLAKLKEGRGLRLRLRLEGAPELVGLPWECLYDPDQKEFLALQVETPVVRYLEVATEPVPEKAPVPLKVLVLSANPESTEALQVEREVQAIQRALSRLGSRVRIVRLAGPSLTELESRLAECHVLHFVGHGTFNDKTGTGALILEGRDGQPRAVDVHDLAGLLPRHHALRLAVLNTCQGARHSDVDAFSGVAQGLVQKGVPAVVAMRHDIEDDAAILFADRLYAAMARGASIPEAVTLGRKAIFAEHGDAWATPTLYMRQDVRIFPRRRPIWPLIAALIGVGAILSALGAYWIPRFIAARQCPSPPGLGMRFVKIPAGSFLMGSEPKAGPDQFHRVALSRPFCLGVYEVTQAQWGAVAHDNPSAVKGDDLPVETVSWRDVQTFLGKLNERDPAGRYRLATEAQWEYAASGGGRGVYGYGDDDRKLREYGNCDQGDRPSPVGSFQPTRWGLHDMHGNVAEWVADLEQYTAAPVVDPMGPTRSDALGVRGGSFKDEPYDCRAAHREVLPPDSRKPSIGFRIVRDPVH